MQKLIILAAFVACGLAAPLENIKETFQIADLPRPSPINPDIPSDPKPVEKVTLIAGEEEQSVPAKQVPVVAGPLALPVGSGLRSKRADKDSSESEEDSSEENKKPSSPASKTAVSTTPSAVGAKTSTTSAPSSSSSTESTSETSTSSTARPRRPYSPLIHQHNEHLFKPTTEAASSAASTTAASVAASSKEHISDKRDIPVPLTRKYHHDESATKQKEEPAAAEASKEDLKQEDKKSEDKKAQPTSHPATIARPIPVAELFAKKPTATSTD